MPTVTIEEGGPAPVCQKSRGVILSWTNIQGGNIPLLKIGFVFLKICFPSLVVNLKCGYISKKCAAIQANVPL